MTRWEVLPPNVKVQSTIGNVKQVSAAGKIPQQDCVL